MFSLNATDAFLKNRVLNLPESLVEGTSYSPEQFIQHLARFRERNVEDETLLNYFEDLEIYSELFGNLTERENLLKYIIHKHIDLVQLLLLEITSNDDHEYITVTGKIYRKVVKPKNYSPNPEEVEEAERRQAEELLKKQEAQMSELQEKEEAQSRAQRWDEWVCSRPAIFQWIVFFDEISFLFILFV